MTWHLTLEGRERPIASVTELRSALDEAAQTQFAEVWLHREGGPMLAMLVNGDDAVLTFLRHEVDSGFISRNLEYVGPPGLKLSFRLANGQVDEYPADWAVSRVEAFHVMEHLFACGEMAPWIFWDEDPENA